MRTVIFDLDGTLADTGADLIAAANACLSQAGGRPLDPVADAATAFRGGRAMLAAGGLTPDQVDQQYPLFLEVYGAALCTHTVLYPGAMAAVDRLDQDGYRVGICTNKPEALAEKLLRALGVRERFGALIGADTLPVRKPDPAPLLETVRRLDGDPKRACLVGDTVTDRQTARAAGVPCILVGFGPGAGGVAALEPEAVIGHFDDLPAAVAALRL